MTLFFFGKGAAFLPSATVFQKTQIKESVNIWTVSINTSTFLIKTCDGTTEWL